MQRTYQWYTVYAMFPTFWRDQTKHVALDLDRELNKNPQSTIICEVQWSSMTEAGIHPGDCVLVDRMKHPVSWAIVVADIDAMFTIKYLGVDEYGNQYLSTSSPATSHERIYPQESLKIMGVVVSSYRTYDG